MGLKWEVAPSLPQEPHYFSGGSSQYKKIHKPYRLIKLACLKAGVVRGSGAFVRAGSSPALGT